MRSGDEGHRGGSRRSPGASLSAERSREKGWRGKAIEHGAERLMKHTLAVQEGKAFAHAKNARKSAQVGVDSGEAEALMESMAAAIGITSLHRAGGGQALDEDREKKYEKEKPGLNCSPLVTGGKGSQTR